MPNNPTVNCDCPTLTMLFLGIAVGVGVTVAADYALPSTEELDARDANRRDRRQLSMRANGAPMRARGGIMGGIDRLSASGW